jgi:hypothetical protein
VDGCPFAVTNQQWRSVFFDCPLTVKIDFQTSKKNKQKTNNKKDETTKKTKSQTQKKKEKKAARST